ncbi:hypothetical protein ACEQ8H_006628 [Pleosporales sp. CAS-2024a]
MYVLAIFTPLIASVAALATPDVSQVGGDSCTAGKQAQPVQPPPCVRCSTVTEFETKIRSDAFAKAFIYDKDISEAFKYIAHDYINHNPSVKNGSDAAWSALSPFWPTSNLTPLRTAFQYPQSWVNYQVPGFGNVVDRFQWDGGCIVEHWDQGEQFPNTTTTTT